MLGTQPCRSLVLCLLLDILHILYLLLVEPIRILRYEYTCINVYLSACMRASICIRSKPTLPPPPLLLLLLLLYQGIIPHLSSCAPPAALKRRSSNGTGERQYLLPEHPAGKYTLLGCMFVNL